MSKFISLKIAHVDKLLISDYLYHATSADIELQYTPHSNLIPLNLACAYLIFSPLILQI